MQPKRIVFALILAFFLFYFALGAFNFFSFGLINSSQDFAFHYSRATGEKDLVNYPYGYHFLFSFFSGNQLSFYLANLFMIVALIPLFLFLVDKNWWSVAIYFCGVPIVHQFLYGAVYPQALIALLFCIYLFLRKYSKLRFFWLIVFGCMALVIHKQGIILFAGVLGSELLVKAFRCLKKEKINLFLMPTALEGPRQIIQICIQQLPVPILFFGLQKISLFEAFLVLGAFYFSFFDLRSLAIAQCVFCLATSRKIKDCNKKVKIGFCLFLVCQLFFYLLDFAAGTYFQLLS